MSAAAADFPAAATVAVAVAVYNQAHFLEDALSSIAAQTRPPDQVIIVDDGSSDDPASVVARFPSYELIRQSNAGLSAARNTALYASACDLIAFLDADDMLQPNAIEAGLASLRAHPHAALTYGGHVRVDESGAPLGPPSFTPVGSDPHADLLRGNAIGMHATALYVRAILAEAGGFDTALRKCEDYDVYLRLSRDFPVACHDDMIAAYRIHGSNMSHDIRAMLDWVERVRRRYRPSVEGRPNHRQAWKEGRRIWRDYYAELMLHAANRGNLMQKGTTLAAAGAIAPRVGARALRRGIKARLKQWLPDAVQRPLKRVLGGPSARGIGKVRMGDLDSIHPVSPDFGFDRGTPVDRYYIERFLKQRSGDIRGRALEIGDASYCRAFGSAISQQDVLHVSADNPEATLVGDLSRPGVLPPDTFDVMVITQTIHLIYDMPQAIRHLYEGLKPGGVLLLTTPGITSIDRGQWGKDWFWSLTEQSTARLMAESFGAENVQTQLFGNVYAATCFLQGLALEEVSKAKLDHVDRSYPMIITVRATKPAA